MEIKFGDELTLVTEKDVAETIMGGFMFKKLEGLPILHALTVSEGKALDLMSLRRNIEVRNIFSFSGLETGFSPKVTYEIGGQDRVYGPDVFIAMNTIKKDGLLTWDPRSFRYALLHENGHATLSKYHRSVEANTDKKELDANAVALLTSRDICQKYPEKNFLDTQEHLRWIKNQLEEGYGIKRRSKDVKDYN